MGMTATVQIRQTWRMWILFIASGTALAWGIGSASGNPAPTPQAIVPVQMPAEPPVSPVADGVPSPEENGPKTDETSAEAKAAQLAVQKALAYLAGAQNAKDGFWINDAGYKLNYNYMVTRRDARHPGVTAIACLAFMAGGHYPGRGQYADNVRKGLEFVLSCVSSDEKTRGFVTCDETRMYSHAFATLFLAEILGMASLSPAEEKRVRDKLHLAVNMIVYFQNEQGAWRYAPGAADADMSIAVCQLQALRAARNVGIRVPPETVDRARAYIGRSYQDYNGTFVYQNDQMDGSRTSWTLTAAGACALQQAGNYDNFVNGSGQRVSLSDSISFLRRNQPYSRSAVMNRPELPFGYFYGYYYATQAVYQYSRVHPDVWPSWLSDVRYRLVALQNQADGTWRDQIGVNYATAMAALILQIHQEYLPIFQK